LHLLPDLGFEQAESLEWVALPNEQPMSLHKRADFVIRNRQTNQLIQLELQSYADSDMLKRCFAYAAPYMFYFNTIPHQYIIHLGNTPANYHPLAFQDDWHSFRIQVVDLKEFPAEPFLQSDIPEAVIFAILCATESRERLVEDILARLRTLVLDNERLGDYFSILDTLGGLRDLSQIIKNKQQHMALQFDKTKTFLFQDGLAVGVTKGKAEGKAEGRNEQLIEIVKEMHADGDTLTKIARICHLTEEQVRTILGLLKS